MAAKRKYKTKKPKGYFLGGVTKSLFGSEQEQSITQPKYVKKLTPDLIDLFRNEFARPDAETVAPLSADAQGAFGQIRDLAYNDPTGYGDALAFSKSAITSGFDANEPWNERLVQATLADYDRSTEMDRARAARDQAGRGAFGDRAYIDQRERDRTATNDRALLEARLMEEGINRRQQAGQALAGLAGAERGQAFTGAQALDLAGQRQEQQQQQVLDTPFRRMQAITPIFGSAPSATNTRQDGNVFSQLTGLGLSIAGLPMFGRKNGGKVEKYQDGGPMLSPRDEQRRIQKALAQALRRGDQEEARQLRRLLNAKIEAAGQGTSALRDPRMEAAEERRAGPAPERPIGAVRLNRALRAASDRFAAAGGTTPETSAPLQAASEFIDDNPISRGLAEGWGVIAGREPLFPSSDRASPAEMPEQLSAPEPGAFTPQPPMPRPARPTAPVAPVSATPARTPQAPTTMRPQPRPPAGSRPRQLVGALDGQQAAQPTPEQAVAIGTQVAAGMAEQVPAEEKGAFAKWIENPLTLMGLGMMASRNPTFFGAFGEGALGALDIMDRRQAQEFQQERQMSEDEREAAEAERRRRRDAIGDEQWAATFGYTQEKDRETFDLARQRLDEEARLNDARIQNFLRPRAGTSAANKPHYSPFVQTAMNKLGEQMAIAQEMGDTAAVQRLLEEYDRLSALVGTEPVGSGLPGNMSDYDFGEVGP